MPGDLCHSVSATPSDTIHVSITQAGRIEPTTYAPTFGSGPRRFADVNSHPWNGSRLPLNFSGGQLFFADDDMSKVPNKKRLGRFFLLSLEVSPEAHR